MASGLSCIVEELWHAAPAPSCLVWEIGRQGHVEQIQWRRSHGTCRAWIQAIDDGRWAQEEANLFPFVFIAASNVGVLVACRGFPSRTFIKVGSTSVIEPPWCWAHLLPPSSLAVGSGRCAPSPTVLSRCASVTLPTAVVEALHKEWDDALGATEDARREVKEERLVAVTVENIHDAA